MKTLLVLRHAKSSWDNDATPDHDRPLSERGKRTAPRMGQLILAERLVPELIVSSTAKRAYNTARKVARACGYSAEIQQEASLYHHGLDTYYGVIHTLPSTLSRVMVVGHNPELEEFLAELTGVDVPMPTAALALIYLAVEDWQSVSRTRTYELVNTWRPRELT